MARTKTAVVDATKVQKLIDVVNKLLNLWWSLAPATRSAFPYIDELMLEVNKVMKEVQ